MKIFSIPISSPVFLVLALFVSTPALSHSSYVDIALQATDSELLDDGDRFASADGSGIALDAHLALTPSVGIRFGLSGVSLDDGSGGDFDFDRRYLGLRVSGEEVVSAPFLFAEIAHLSREDSSADVGSGPVITFGGSIVNSADLRFEVALFYQNLDYTVSDPSFGTANIDANGLGYSFKLAAPVSETLSVFGEFKSVSLQHEEASGIYLFDELTSDIKVGLRVNF